MANVKYRSVYYNTTGTSVEWTIEILDTQAVAQVINFESVNHDESFEGLTDDFRPGIYPSSFKFGMYLRDSPVVSNGTTYGPSAGFWYDIFESAEGRFLVRLLKDGDMHFIGPIIYDQCTLTDEDTPLMSITAVDGLTKLQTEDYTSLVGQIEYYSTEGTTNVWDTTPLIFDGLDPTAWIVIEHTANIYSFLNIQKTTFARRSIYAKSSPGTGWTSVGSGQWVKTLTYTNEQEVEVVNVSYKLTRDIDDDKQRPVSEYFLRAMEATKMQDEYSDIMYDVSANWYEHDIGDLTADPFTQIRLHEEPLIGKNWKEVLEKITKLFFLRIYHSKGRFHFEQISMRSISTLKRYVYLSDGTSAGAAETASLDLNFNTLPVSPLAGGIWKGLAPFKSVEATIKLDRSDLFKDIYWSHGSMGQKYLGRIQRKTGAQYAWIGLRHDLISTFDPTILATLDSSLINSLCKHDFVVTVEIRLVNIDTGATYWLRTEATGVSTWEATQYSYERRTKFGQFQQFSVDNYGININQWIQFKSENIPDPEGAMFDVFASVNFAIDWDNASGETLWEETYPDNHWHTLQSDYPNQNGLRATTFRILSSNDPITDHADSISQNRTIFIENDVSNSVKVNIELDWCDTNQIEKGIQYYDGTIWKNSSTWSVNGTGTGVEIMKLLVTEVMRLRKLPRQLYSGSFASSLPNTENRYQRESYFYLPLSCSRDGDIDTFKGEFIQIEPSEADDPEIISDPIDGGPIGGPTSVGDPSGDVPVDEEDALYFETNEVITSGVAITEVDILNTQGWSIASGNTVKILNLDTGESETVTLTQDVEPGDTIMYFTSYSFLNNYPDASPIIINAVSPPVLSNLNKYHYFNRNYSSQYHVVSQFPFSVLNNMNNNQRDKKVHISRNGVRMFCTRGLGLTPQIDGWDFSSDDDWFVFDLAFTNERILIDVDLKR